MRDEYEFLHFPPEAVHVEPQKLEALPESAQRVFHAIRDDGPVTHATLREETGMPARTIRFAVKRLKEEGLIDARSSLRDCRTSYFFVARNCIDPRVLDAARRHADFVAERDHRLIEHV